MTIEWLLGFAIAAITLVGGIIARDRSLMSTIQKGDDALHERINRTRDDYVRRVDLDGHLTRLDETMKDMRVDMKDHNSDVTGRIDKLILALSNKPSGDAK
jgi:hypothetical protein